MSDEAGNTGSRDVEAAVAILRDAGFPVERVRILPASTVPEKRGKQQDDDEPDRQALLQACLDALKDGKARTARDLSDVVQSRFSDEITKRQVNSVLSKEGRDLVTYDRETYTYSLRQ